ncbi:hypothetical protein [Chlamydia felis Fe/C-56]|uniref:Uncharacterized protein n=1 Tax=Chlamydia felis (strain Fe/C-56) TaxID=264202 RepID=Q254V0_CHLFF|nr:hypothetical protein [Chlamydia felis]BAE81188.1 hypothetical protein [Chlamydia felis Fe/C-56]
MLIDRYSNNYNFCEGTKDHFFLFRSGFVRDLRGLRSLKGEWNLSIARGICSKTNMHEIGKTLPIIGTILGLGRLYSVWSTKDDKSSKIRLFLHTLTGVIETLGLGIIILIAKIARIAITTLCEKIGPRCFCNRYQNLESGHYSLTSSDSDSETETEIENTAQTGKLINNTTVLLTNTEPSQVQEELQEGLNVVNSISSTTQNLVKGITQNKTTFVLPTTQEETSKENTTDPS